DLCQANHRRHLKQITPGADPKFRTMPQRSLRHLHERAGRALEIRQMPDVFTFFHLSRDFRMFWGNHGIMRDLHIALSPAYDEMIITNTDPFAFFGAIVQHTQHGHRWPPGRPERRCIVTRRRALRDRRAGQYFLARRCAVHYRSAYDRLFPRWRVTAL